MSWHNKPLCGFDVESGGTSVEEDRIVQIALVVVDASKKTVAPDVRLIHPGVDISAESIAVHGITNERLRVEGGNPAEVLEFFADELTAAMEIGAAVVGANLVFDFTMLDRELRRNGLRTLESRLGQPIAPIVDVLVLDRWAHRFRKGGRKLTDLCDHYGVKHDGAHDAGADALAACRIAWRMVQWGGLPLSHFEKHPAIGARARQVAAQYKKLAGLPLAELHALQVEAKREQDASLAEYFRGKGQAFDGLTGDWPLVPFVPGVQQAIAS